MKPERFKRTKSVVASSAIALVVAALVVGVSSLVIGSRSAPSPQIGFELTGSTCPASPLTGANFSVCGPSAGHGPVLFPGAAASTLPLNFYNPLSVAIDVTSLTLKFTNAFPGNCVSSAYQVNGTALAGSPPQVTLTFTSGHYIQVSGNSATSPGATYDATLALANSGNQNACKGLALTMSYTASAQYTDATTTILVSSPNPSLFGQSVTFTATISANNSTADTSQPTGTVTFYSCSTAACTGTKTALTAALTINASGQASFSTSALSLGTHYLDAVYAPTDATGFMASNGLLTQTVGLPSSCDHSTHNGGYTVNTGQSICLTGRVNGGLTVASGGAVYLSGATINGGITSTGATAIRICGTSVSGNVSVSGSTGYVMIGDGSDDGTPACAGNTITGNLGITNNTGGIEVGGNSGATSVTISGNAYSGYVGEGVAEVEANKISGGLSCAISNNPALTDGGLPNSVSGSRSGQCAGAF